MYKTDSITFLLQDMPGMKAHKEGKCPREGKNVTAQHILTHGSDHHPTSETIFDYQLRDKQDQGSSFKTKTTKIQVSTMRL